ncbi:MAG: ABC transporter ATP-binding protein [Rhizobiaceae bacterium MnEN-MB40S]|nr:MAG: ABC transporter ATP-binding protein [Rhizobiaceae bacterium MnEN-MB40S]
MPALLHLDRVTRRYALPRRSLIRAPSPLTAVSNVSLTIARGETLGVVGESGSGKSTLARLAMGFERPDEGAVRFAGKELAGLSKQELKALRPRFQMVFQDPYGSLDPRRRVGWSVAEPLRVLRRAEPAVIASQVNAVLERVGLRAEDAGKFPHEFSGGQRQRIAIARGIVTNPDLLIADEAVSALDVSVQAQILNLLMDLRDDMGLGLFFISHDLQVVSSISDRIVVLKQGEIVDDGPTDDVMFRSRNPYTRSLMAAAGWRAAAETQSAAIER